MEYPIRAHPRSQERKAMPPIPSADRDETTGHGRDATTDQFFKHSTAPRVSTDTVITKALKEQYPELELVVAPQYGCNLFGFAATGRATITRIEDGSELPSSLQWTMYLPPTRRLDGEQGVLAQSLQFGKYLYKWDNTEFLIYFVDGRDGMEAYPRLELFYILTPETQKADALILAAGLWTNDLHNEIWVYDGGYWSKDRALWDSAQKATWDAVILDEEMKQSLIDDHVSFFESRDNYAKLKVPWKRGLIYYGPPGNGKTISIKATMHMLSSRDPSIPTLYVRSLRSWDGPEGAIQDIFRKAREFAPCYLVLEDIDTIITPDVRSYFLNEVDGLKANDGILMIASTNHLDRLDPGIGKRPSRFDRKYYFPDPNVDQREAYCHFWQRKLKDNKDIEFPDKLCRAIAEITGEFSFAYIQEAFVATLLAIARKSKDQRQNGESDDAWLLVTETGGTKECSAGVQSDGDIEELPLWKEMKKQVKILREEMEDES